MNDLEDDLHVDLTPLIDVIFMLVIFFIMTMSFTLPVVEFNLPESQTAQTTRVPNVMRIEVSADGRFKVSGEELGFEGVEAAVKRRATEEKDLTLELLIDAKASAENLIRAADLSRMYTQGRLLVISELKERAEEDSGGILSKDRHQAQDH